MVYSSSLMETNFFVARRREFVLRAVEEASKIKTIQQLNKVRRVGRGGEGSRGGDEGGGQGTG